MTEFKYNRYLLILMVVGLAAALIIGWQRHIVEEKNSQVEMVVDYEDIIGLAQTDGVPVPVLMQQFREAGLTSVAVYDATLEKLQKSGKLTVFSGADLLARLRTGEIGKYPFSDKNGQIDPARVYIFTGLLNNDSRTIFEEVKDDLIRRLGPERVHLLSTADNQPGLAIDANYENILETGLGLASWEMREVSGYGFQIVARPNNFTKVRPSDIDSVFAKLSGFENVSGIMFAGQEGVLGYPDLVKLTAEHMRKRNLCLYAVENPLQLQFLKQEGLLPLMADTGYRTARAYVILKEEQPKLKIADAVHRWVLSDRERNIRVNLIRAYDKPESGMNLTETNLKYIRDVKQALVNNGFTIGTAGIYQPYYPSKLLLALVVIGTTAAGILFLTLVRPFRERYQYALLAILSLLLITPLFAGSGMLVRQATAIVSAVVFPVLAMTWQLDRWRLRRPAEGSSLRKIIFDGVSGLSITVLLSLAGGIYLGAVLADVRFILDAEIYRGVKLTFILPPVLITLTYLARFNVFTGHSADEKTGIIKQLYKVLNYPVYFKTLVMVAAGAVAAWLFIGRSGHTSGAPVPGIELKLRTFLEAVMYARPREKEFIVGHPAFLLAVMALYRNWPRVFHYLFVVAATVGQGSLVETFAHIRTPIFMSLVRGIDGLILGAVLGVAAVIAIQVLHYLSFLLGRGSAADE